jgi:hypothetical protein
MKVWNYSVSYDKDKDQFFAMVDDGAKPIRCPFTIDDTAEICDLIRTGVMKHVDDTEGLEEFLKRQEIIGPEDCVLIEEWALW